MPAVESEKRRYATFPLQSRNVNVQVHSVDTLDLQRDVFTQNFGDASCYAHLGSGTTPILRDRLPPRRPILLDENCSQFSTPSTGAILA